MNRAQRIPRMSSCARIFACVFLGFFGAGTARAQLTSCPGAAQAGGFKVLLDEIYYTSAAPLASGSTISMDRLQFRILTQLEQIVEETEMRPDVVKCAGRRPRGANDFTRNQVDQLNAQGVVLEIWGTVDNAPGAGGQPAEVALVGYALIPLRFYEHFVNGSQEIRGVVLKEYTSPSGPATTLLEQSSEFQAFTSLGIGMKALKVNNYDQARKYFCKAELLLQAGATNQPSAESKTLLDHTRDLAVAAFKQAQADNTYTGALRLQRPEDIAAGCGGTEVVP